MKLNPLRYKLIRFAFIGLVGFAIEAVLVTYFATIPDVGPIKGRLISFPLAVLATWWLNRKLTFRSTGNPRTESLRYFMVQTLGALTNLLVFTLTVLAYPALGQIPVIPLFLASLVALVLNFTLAKRFVFLAPAEQV